MTNIQWTDKTWNPVVGCSKISAGCANCYAAEAAKSARLQQFLQYQQVAQWDGSVTFVESQLLKPLKWRSPRKIFVCSMADIFHENVSFEWLNQIFAVMAIAYQHTFQVLTKRPQRMLEYFSDPNRARWITDRALEILRDDTNPTNWRFKVVNNTFEVRIPLVNVWIGVSVENQIAARDRIPLLLRTLASKRFLSCEPVLECLDLSEWLNESANPKLNWIICGGESGKNAREVHLDWLRSLIAQAASVNVPIFVKQLGSSPFDNKPLPHFKDPKGGDISEFPQELQLRQFP